MYGIGIKSIAAFIAFALLAARPGFCQHRKTGRERDSLLGDVYAVREAVLTSAHQPVEPPSQQRHTTSYYDKHGDLILKMDYVAGRMVRRRTFLHTGADEITEKIEDGGVDSAADVVGPNPPPDRMVRHSLKFDGDGNLAEESLFAEDGSRLGRTVFKRDQQGRLLETDMSSGRASARESKTTYTYRDGSEPDSSTQEYFPGQPVTEHYSYEFDSKGNWIKKLMASSAQVVERTIVYYSPDVGPAEPEHDWMPGETPTDLLQATPLSALPRVIRKSGGVLQATAIRRVEPAYPMNAKAAHITGSVAVEIRINHLGAVADAKALSGPQQLQAAAIQAAKQWRFQPTTLSGVLVDVIGVITFNFQM
jgi:TonB family protein